MSWDIFVQDIPRSAKSVAEIPDDFKPRPLGTRAEIVSRICEAVPTADFRTAGLGQVRGPDFSIEISMPDSEEVSAFAFHVRGGDLAAAVVDDILRHLGFRAFDPSSASGIFAVEGRPADGLRRWREYRDTILANPNSH